MAVRKAVLYFFKLGVLMDRFVIDHQKSHNFPLYLVVHKRDFYPVHFHVFIAFSSYTLGYN